MASSNRDLQGRWVGESDAQSSQLSSSSAGSSSEESSPDESSGRNSVLFSW